ncbi:hypothetical protein ACO0LB_07150 [Undibacterium sp. SXout7W]|uniref:hypothetical protein n=1 Tax=Undibacterium sp. SXout7W TaxID=3413049 RepID=UPI003BF1B104
MKNLELIIPFCIPPVGLEKDLLRELRTPSLARLIAAAGKPRLQMAEDFARALPHEYWQTGQFPPLPDANSPPLTWNRMRDIGLDPQQGHWFTMQPVHIHIARDHLVLTDQRRLDLPEEEARVLFDIAQEACREAQLELRYGNAQTWFLRADAWSDLQTATSDVACGHNIDIWMPKGEYERQWRKLQNEIQMSWFAHEINHRREMRGDKPVNSVWLSGGASGFQQNNVQASSIHLDLLSEAAINNDWGHWLHQMQILEDEHFSTQLQALQNKQISQLDLLVSDTQRLARFSVTRWGLRRFWVKPSLHTLFTLPSS